MLRLKNLVLQLLLMFMFSIINLGSMTILIGWLAFKVGVSAIIIALFIPVILLILFINWTNQLTFTTTMVIALVSIIITATLTYFTDSYLALNGYNGNRVLFFWHSNIYLVFFRFTTLNVR